MIVFCLSMILWEVRWRAELSPTYPYARYNATGVALLFLLNQLAYEFRWPARVTVVLRVVWYAWLVFLGCYLYVQVRSLE